MHDEVLKSLAQAAAHLTILPRIPENTLVDTTLALHLDPPKATSQYHRSQCV
jgi:hypothetical protein